MATVVLRCFSSSPQIGGILQKDPQHPLFDLFFFPSNSPPFLPPRGPKAASDTIFFPPLQKHGTEGEEKSEGDSTFLSFSFSLFTLPHTPPALQRHRP